METEKRLTEQEIINALSGKKVNIKDTRFGATVLKISDDIISIETAKDDMGVLYYLYGNRGFIDTLILTDEEAEILIKHGHVYIGGADIEILTTIELADF